MGIEGEGGGFDSIEGVLLWMGGLVWVLLVGDGWKMLEMLRERRECLEHQELLEFQEHPALQGQKVRLEHWEHRELAEHLEYRVHLVHQELGEHLEHQVLEEFLEHRESVEELEQMEHLELLGHQEQEEQLNFPAQEECLELVE